MTVAILTFFTSGIKIADDDKPDAPKDDDLSMVLMGYPKGFS